MEEKQDRISLHQFKNIIKILSGSMDDYLYIYDFSNDYYCISENAAVRFLMPSTEFHDVVEHLKEVTVPEDFALLEQDLQEISDGKKERHDMQYRWLDKERHAVWISCRGRVVYDDYGRPEFLVGCVNEIGQNQVADNVSGLLRESGLKKDILDCKGYLHGFMLRLGIDRFKEINEDKGMDYGDKILRKTADRIKAVIRPGQKLYRIVADEFVVVDFVGGTQADAIRLYEDIRQSIMLFIIENKYEVFYTISGGILDFQNVENHSYFNLMKLSEFAMTEAKEAGRNRYFVYTNEAYNAFIHKKELMYIIRNNVVNNGFEGFEAYFQPLMDLKERKLIGAETLMRFSCEEYGRISPYQFIPLLEDSGLIIPVGRWILYRSMEVCKQIQSIIPYFKMSVNVSYIQVLRSNVLGDIVKGLKRYELDASSIQIELTESGFLEKNDEFVRFCDGLKNLGVQIALDDFGTGYSNFHYLGYLTPDTIKIDRSFTIKGLQNDYEFGLLQHMAALVHSIDSKLCIEGIENEDELNKISEIEPDYIQGYYFGKPCTLEEFWKKYVDVK